MSSKSWVRSPFFFFRDRECFCFYFFIFSIFIFSFFHFFYCIAIPVHSVLECTRVRPCVRTRVCIGTYYFNQYNMYVQCTIPRVLHYCNIAILQYCNTYGMDAWIHSVSNSMLCTGIYP